jgi:hypothetical protein
MNELYGGEEEVICGLCIWHARRTPKLPTLDLGRLSAEPGTWPEEESLSRVVAYCLRLGPKPKRKARPNSPAKGAAFV